MTNGTPPPTWPIEPTVWYVVFYYPNTQLNTAPTLTSLVMKTYNDAVTQAKTYITNAGNVGACAISQVTGSIVYSSIPWQDF